MILMLRAFTWPFNRIAQTFLDIGSMFCTYSYFAKVTLARKLTVDSSFITFLPVPLAKRENLCICSKNTGTGTKRNDLIFL